MDATWEERIMAAVGIPDHARWELPSAEARECLRTIDSSSDELQKYSSTEQRSAL